MLKVVILTLGHLEVKTFLKTENHCVLDRGRSCYLFFYLTSFIYCVLDFVCCLNI